MVNASKNKWIVGIVAATCFTFASIASIASEEAQNQIAAHCKSYLEPDSVPQNLSANANAALKACYENNSCQTATLSDVSGCTRKLLNWESSYDLPTKNTPAQTDTKTASPATPITTQPTATTTTAPRENIAPPVDLSGNNPDTEKNPQEKKADKPEINWF